METPRIQAIELMENTQKAQKADKPPSANERTPWHEEMLVYSLLYGKRPENHYRTSVLGSTKKFSSTSVLYKCIVIFCSPSKWTIDYSIDPLFS